jgi:hypothetical protein
MGNICLKMRHVPSFNCSIWHNPQTHHFQAIIPRLAPLVQLSN